MNENIIWLEETAGHLEGQVFQEALRLLLQNPDPAIPEAVRGQFERIRRAITTILGDGMRAAPLQRV